MTTILSTQAAAVLASHEVRKRGGLVPVEELPGHLERFGVAPDRARAGVERAVTTGCLVTVVDDDGRPCVRARTAFDIAADMFDPAGAGSAA